MYRIKVKVKVVYSC